MDDGDAARGLRAIVRGFAESGALMFLIDRDDFVKHAVGDLRGEGFDVHVALTDVTDEAQMVRAFAETGEVWGNLYTLINNATAIAIKDLEPPASGIFSASCNSGGRPSPNLRAGLPSAADTTKPRHRAAAGHRRGDPPPPPAGVGGGDRPIPNPPPQQRTTWTSAHDAKPSSTARTERRCPGRFPDQPVPR